MTGSQIQKGLLPAGLSDILYPKAQVQAKKIENLLDVFSNYGYLRVKPPLVEYEETLLSDGPGTVLKDSTFRIMDPLSQKMMALRSDVTAQISRIASTRLSHLARPLRLSYSGDVLRVKGDSFNTERQKTQVGAELIGLENEFCDAEIILICLKALKSINIENITIDMNLPFLREYFLKDLSSSLKEEINKAIDLRDKKSLQKFKFKYSKIVLDLLEASGDYSFATNFLSKLKLEGFINDVRDYYLRVIDIVDKNDSSIKISIDPLENRGFNYHTGLSFTIFSENLKGEIAKGGRYKTLNGETAIGCTIYTEKIYSNSKSSIDKSLVYVPYLNINDADHIISKGYRVVFGNNLTSDLKKDALNLKCQFIWENKKIVKLET
ncbi:MAG: ATP phosphoribosyltransferase regulatory subunit [Alphaproteobacteria bacterium]|nr:MAG: ATP phosphoribosyltransferase regulatory subunit [Alphaproteobacteria bacterium]